MVNAPGKRRLSTVLMADIAGYTRLVEEDTDGTVAAWRAARTDVIDPTIAEHSGRIIKHTGDGFLAEFSSVQDAVDCAREMQRGLVPSPLEFRVGISLGDVIDDGEDIHGEGVNIAARIEALAEPGGICISGAVYDAVRNRVGAVFADMGDHRVKHVSAPVRVYRIEVAPNTETESAGNPGHASKPSIAVLPFTNMSNDPEQEFFVDGLTEDILTELSRRHELFVISRNSTFVYKGRPVNIREISEKLGAQYVVEGSVRKAGDRLRVTVQLIDTASDAHIWAERYDRNLDDIFAIQDEVTSAIVATLPGRVEAAQHDQLSRKKPSSLAAYECLLAAKVLHHRSTPQDNVEALKLIDRALELDPGYAHAHAWRGCILGQAWGYGWCEDKDATFAEVVSELDKALSLDDNDADVHRILAAASITRNDLGRARYHQERALALNPNYDLVVVQMGELLTWLGRPEEGIEWIRKAMRLNPHHPARFWSHLGKAHFAARQYAEAIEAFMHLSAMDAMQHAFVAACHGWLDDQAAAARHAARIREQAPAFELESFLETMHYANEADLQHLREGLTRAGISGA